MYARYWFHFALATAALSGDCPCELMIGDDAESSILTYLEDFAKNKMEECCPNHGPHFSSWGKETCPETFEEIYKQAKQGMAAADGGKSGYKVLLTNNLVIKQVAPFELESVQKLLAKMSESYREHGAKESLIAPICRVFGVTHLGKSRTMAIMLNMKMKNSHLFPESLLFDLKGNSGSSARTAGSNSVVRKDKDFWMTFPSGMHITDPSLREEMEGKIVSDTKLLNDLKHTDYSFMLHMYEWCERPIQDCAAQYSVEREAAEPFELRLFRKTCVRLDSGHMARPVYVNEKKEFLYYYYNAWRIGIDFRSNDTTLFAEGDLPCPDARAAWGIGTGEKFKEVSVRVYSEGSKDIELDFHSKHAMKQANPHVPMVFATASTKEGIKTFVVSYALIDVLLPDNKIQVGNELKKYVFAADCRQDDLSQLDSSSFRARFLMMWNHRLTEPCIAKNSYFTYFLRTDKLLAMEACPEGETACKSLCKHLRLAGPSEPNGQCKAVKEILDPCKTVAHRYGMKLWSSSQDKIEDLLSKNIWEYQVKHFVEEIWKEFNSMDKRKREKYAKCHEQITRALADFDNRQACKIDDEGTDQSCK